ncbi:Dynamin [Penicillium capsulatum]|uniref:Dynamin n=1 Tax=Penicillium capsulatum TaxID=69766 RepID=A0A9W9ID65_9EURO|nr:Dynamin [Penicillium capsulatum]
MSVPGFVAINMPSGRMPQPRPSTDTSFSAIEELSRDMKDLVKKIQNLSHLGIEDSKIRLPKICIVGDQSTGKSSVIEAISEIKVPRAEGTCTRCPLEINLSESDPGHRWKCVVSLTQRYAFDPKKNFSGAVEAANGTKKVERLGPWARLENRGDTNEFFCTVTNRGQLEEAISRAQCATLNPSRNPDDFKTGNFHENPSLNQVKFSPNVVCLDISGPRFPTLCFFDLPGVINQAEREEETYLVGLVEKLVKQYVSQESCIVLLAMSMTDDAVNSSAARIVRNIKNAKERTMGVLTKPDRVPHQHEVLAQWVEVLNGSKFKLGHGYYVVKNNSDPNVNHATAREQEKQFFAGSFQAGAMGSFIGRFGVPRLQSALSKVLLEKIKKCLPSIVFQINTKAQRIDDELETLPDPPTDNFQHIVLESVIKFQARIENIFNGGPGSGLLQKFWNEIVTDFQKAIAVTRPTMQTLVSSDTDDLAEKEGDHENTPGLSSSRFKRKAAVMEARPEMPTQPRPRHSGPTYLTSYFEAWRLPAQSISLDAVRSLKQETNQVGIPNQIDPSAVETLKKDSVKHWEGIAQDFAKALLGVIKKVLFMTLDEVIVNHRQTGLYRELYRIIEAFLAQIQANYLDEVSAYARMEHDRPFTLAALAHKEAMEKAKNALTRGRNRSRAKHWISLRSLSDEYVERVEAELGADPYAQEVEMVASSRAYYEVASSRFLDVICLIAEAKLRAKCRGDLITVVNSELRVNCLERCIELMAEDPERQTRRIALSKERAKLRQAQEWLASVSSSQEEDETMVSDVTMEDEGIGFA